MPLMVVLLLFDNYKHKLQFYVPRAMHMLLVFIVLLSIFLLVGHDISSVFLCSLDYLIIDCQK